MYARSFYVDLHYIYYIMKINYTSFSDDKLISLYLQGDNLAFDALFDRYSDRIFKYIIGIVKDYDIANDFFQDTFIKVICNLKSNKYKSDGKFSQWLYRLTYNLVFDQYRKDKNRLKISLDDISYSEIIYKEYYYQQNIEDTIIYDQTIKDVKFLLDELPLSQKEVVKMRFYEGMSFQEIADSTNVSINTALGRMRYGILNMKKKAESMTMFC